MSKENKEAKEIIQLKLDLADRQKKIDEARHKFKMEEIIFERESNRLAHERTLERGRIKRAEDRKIMLEKRSLGQWPQ